MGSIDVAPAELAQIAIKVRNGERLSFEDGVALYRSLELLEIGRMAEERCRKLNGRVVHYIVNRHINHTNICVNACRFCAYFRPPGHPEAYAMSLEDVFRHAEQVMRPEIRELHIVGGLHPDLPYAYYTGLLKGLSSRFPQVHLQAFTMVEIDHIARLGGRSVEETLRDLQSAGLGSLPGGGAEVFSPEVRGKVCTRKISGERWLEIARTAHRLGLRTNASILYGHVETAAERVDHLIRLRELQDETGGFLAFIPLSYHAGNTELGGPGTTGIDDLKTIAIARLMLDNIRHIKAFWIMLGPKLAQVALHFGADDIDGTVEEERITHSAGASTPQSLSRSEITRLIRDADRDPVERDTLYNRV